MASLFIATRGAHHAPLDVLLSTIPSLPRPLLARLAERLVERLDQIDGDPDLEPDGDEQDANIAEDDHLPARNWGGVSPGPGCPIADSDMGEDEAGEPEEGV